VDPDQVYRIRYLEGMELLLLKESGSASFGTKVALSLNGADPSFMNSVIGSACREQSAQISYMIVKKFCSTGPRTFCLFCLQQR
jgi:hypothetical protein